MIDMINLMAQYPIGASLHLKEDYPNMKHEVIGYEWFAGNANILFRDGTKINIDRLKWSMEEQHK